MAGVGGGEGGADPSQVFHWIRVTRLLLRARRRREGPAPPPPQASVFNLLLATVGVRPSVPPTLQLSLRPHSRGDESPARPRLPTEGSGGGQALRNSLSQRRFEIEGGGGGGGAEQDSGGGGAASGAGVSSSRSGGGGDSASVFQGGGTPGGGGWAGTVELDEGGAWVVSSPVAPAVI